MTRTLTCSRPVLRIAAEVKTTLGPVSERYSGHACDAVSKSKPPVTGTSIAFSGASNRAVLFAASNVACGDAVYKVGVTMRDLVPAEPYDWRGTKAHALRAVIWYPAAADAREAPQWIGPPIFPFFSAGSAAPNAPAVVGSRRPLILLSHGNGSAGLGLAWIGTALAAHGFIVAAVDHPGNNSNDGTTVEGFSLFWLRAVDLRATINAILDDKSFGSLVDASRIGAAGHSY